MLLLDSFHPGASQADPVRGKKYFPSFETLLQTGNPQQQKLQKWFKIMQVEVLLVLVPFQSLLLCLFLDLVILAYFHAITLAYYTAKC